jgi:hypothetical protein
MRFSSTAVLLAAVLPSAFAAPAGDSNVPIEKRDNPGVEICTKT